MNCPKCGAELTPGQKFCGVCGAPVQEAAPQSVPVQNPTYEQPPVQQPQMQPMPAAQPPKKNNKTLMIVLIIVGVIVVLLIAVILITRSFVKKVASVSDEIAEELELELDDIDSALDLDLPGDESESLDDQLEEINQYLEDYSSEDLDLDSSDSSESSDSELTSYEFVDASIDGDIVKIIPNGKLNGKTVLYNGKDLDGLLDYIDDKVLEPGRTINRDLFYDLAAISIVDTSLYDGIDDDFKINLIYALAVANNFYNFDIDIKDCLIDQKDQSNWKYELVAEGKEDIWHFNYSKNEVYFNDGGTQYHSDMFDDQYLAVWFTAIEDYFGFE